MSNLNRPVISSVESRVRAVLAANGCESEFGLIQWCNFFDRDVGFIGQLEESYIVSELSDDDIVLLFNEFERYQNDLCGTAYYEDSPETWCVL